jgi:hypothetical protein
VNPEPQPIGENTHAIFAHHHHLPIRRTVRRGQGKARDWWRQGALDHEWWESTYEDAANVGLKITSFDTDRGNSITGDFEGDAASCANKILKDHGKDCPTYKVAEAFLEERQALQDKYDAAYEADEDWRVTRKIEESIGELDDEFKRAILEEYLHILRGEADYLMEDAQVDEAIRANEYEFLESGKRA